MRRILTTALLATAPLLLAPAAVQAQDAGKWNFGLGAATDNRSKDASKSGGDPYAWGSAEWENASGFFYGEAGAETIKSSGSELETRLGLGVRPQWAGFDFDLNAVHKWRIDADDGSDPEAWEFTADMKRSIGPASGRLRVQYSPDAQGSTKAFTWVEGQVGWDFTNKLSGSVAVGRREQDNGPDYTGWNIGGSYALTRNLELDVRYYDTSADALGEQYADAVVAGISVYF